MKSKAEQAHQLRIVPELQRIQHAQGYLDRASLEAFSKSSGIPLHRINAVASFFPHFRATPPTRVTLHICRDMSCHLAGASRLLEELAPLTTEGVEVAGVSCLGRCDAAPAACLTRRGGTDASRGAAAKRDHPFSGEQYVRIVSAEDARRLLQDADDDDAADQTTGAPSASLPAPAAPRMGAAWSIDPYDERTSHYGAARAFAAARATAIHRAAELLRSRAGWLPDAAEGFVDAATRRLSATSSGAPVADAVRAWQTATAWATGPELGDWADALLDELDDARADLRGLGGAGIPATQKWRDVRDAVRTARRRRADDDRAFVVVNGDESEPATFKDRELLLRYPHLVLEGVILAGLVTDATEGLIYVRHEYPDQIAACRREIQRAEALGLCGRNATVLGRPFPVSVFVSPGGYICGEQSALIEAMSDRRAEPRNMPPKLETNGLDDCPTLVSNVETFAWVPHIAVRGGKAYAACGVNGWRGRRFFSVSGDVRRPGVYEVPMGLTLRELVCGAGYCQGVCRDGRSAQLKAIAPSGPSGGFLPAKLTARAGLPRDHVHNKAWQALAARRGFDANAQELDVLDLELELNLFRALSPTQALGAGIVVYAQGRDMVEQAVNAMEFYRNETCGKCVPCRIGTRKLVALGTNLVAGRIDPDRWTAELLPTVRELGKVMELTSICGLGRSASVPLRTAIDFFPEDVARHTGAAEPAPAAEASGQAQVPPAPPRKVPLPVAGGVP